MLLKLCPCPISRKVPICEQVRSSKNGLIQSRNNTKSHIFITFLCMHVRLILPILNPTIKSRVVQSYGFVILVK